MTEQLEGAAKIRMLERLRGIMALQDSANEGEAANAAALAAKLIQQYNLDAEEVAQATGKADGVVIVEQMAVEIPHPGEIWVARLASVIAGEFFCRLMRHERYLEREDGKQRKHVFQYIFIGRKDNSDAAVFAFNNLYSQLKVLATKRTNAYATQMKQLWGTKSFDPWKDLKGTEHPYAFRMAFLDGAVNGILQALLNQHEKFNKEKNASAVVVVREGEIKEYIAEKYPHSGTFRSRVTRKVNGDGWEAGYNAGKQMQVNPGLEGGR